MLPRKILCCGDSNTYGYDPRDPLGDRYDQGSRWCDLLAQATGWQVINGGENGKPIPTDPWEFRELDRFLQKHPQGEALLVMLGSNDALMLYPPNPRLVADRMAVLLAHLETSWPQLKVVLLAPPPTSLKDFAPSIAALGEEYRRLAEARRIPFLNTQDWGLALSFDGLHLSEEGHRTLAQRLAQALPPLLD